METRQHPQYPESRYLVGIGQASGVGRDRGWLQARDRAVADIAAQLETHIRSEIATVVRETLDIRGNERQARSLTQMSSEVLAVSEASLKNIKQVAQWYDDRSQEAAVMVAIARSDHVEIAREEARKLDAELDVLSREAAQLQKDGRDFQASLRLAKAEKLALDRRAVRSGANFVLPGAIPGDGPISLGQALERRRAAAGRTHLLVSCRHDDSGLGGERRGGERLGELEQRFVSAFGDMGAQVRPAGGDAAEIARRWRDTEFLKTLATGSEGQALLLLVEARSTSRPVGEAELVRVLSSGTARLVDAQNGELLVSVSFSPDAARSAAKIGPARVQQRLADEALAQLAEQLHERLMEELQ